jgi:protein-S-isoprenylcysteine O-methyltransferase Ste14
MQFLLDIAVTAVSLTVIAEFVWAMRFHFKTDKMALAAKSISLIGTLAIILFIYLQFTRVQPIAVLVAGVALGVLSSVIFIAAIRASRKAQLYFVFEGRRPDALLKDGPFAYIRHPFYASYVLLWGAWGLATWAPISVLPVAVLTAIYVNAARGEERNIALSPLAADYAQYKRQAGFFWPRLGGTATGAPATPQK